MSEKISDFQSFTWRTVLEAPVSSENLGQHFIVGVFQDTNSQPILPFLDPSFSLLEAVLKRKEFSGAYGAHSTFQELHSETPRSKEVRVFSLVGLGRAEGFNLEKGRSLGGQLWPKLRSQSKKQPILIADSFIPIQNSTSLKKELSEKDGLHGILEGIALASYEFKKYFSHPQQKTNQKEQTQGKSQEKAISWKTLFIWTQIQKQQAFLNQWCEEAEAIREALTLTRDWSNEPSNRGTPEYYAQEAKKLAQKYGFKCHILTEKEAQREKMGMYLAVGQGSEREGRIVILEYNPINSQKPKNQVKTLGLVGKGVTFDSGGISIKPAMKMEDMKHDMTGAASVMGALILLARWKAPHRVIGMMAFTENMPSGKAVQPGNIVTARNGKTIEIINTDAEGRLVLGDALHYVQDHYSPEALVDIATLTGAVGVALGKHCAAILGNDEDLIQSLKESGETHGERLWPLPLFPEYLEDMKSDFADLKNAANDGYAGTIRAAAFLQEFIKKGTRWAHLDIASTAYQMGHLSYYPKKGASGAYVRTLAQWVMKYNGHTKEIKETTKRKQTTKKEKKK